MPSIVDGIANTLGQGRTVSPATPASPAGAEREIYTFTNACRWAFVQNKPTSGIRMHVLFNDDSSSFVAGTTLADAVLEPSDSVASPPKDVIKTIGIYFSGAATYGADFLIRGRE